MSPIKTSSEDLLVFLIVAIQDYPTLFQHSRMKLGVLVIVLMVSFTETPLHISSVAGKGISNLSW